MRNNVYSQSQTRTIDEGLRSYMLKVYNFMAGGLCLTGVAAWLVANTSLLGVFFNITPQGASLSGLGWLALIAPLIMVFAFSWVVSSGTAKQVQMLFWSYSLLMGVSLTPAFLLYTQSSLVRVFLITAGSFGALSLYGYTTKKDLSGLGSFLIMGLFGLIIASIVNIFVKSSGFDWALSFIGVGIFAGLTAFDSQRIRSIYSSADSDETLTKKALMGALSLYLDFINLFLYLLRFMGDRK
ncbi:MAG: Bax inhibitor-1/YccA family protein [Alphaproteobacteria bacterium]|nr:Bax inhibitor-1/YccA family protein [Alphaproteobacteria bacterium]